MIGIGQKRSERCLSEERIDLEPEIDVDASKSLKSFYQAGGRKLLL